MRKSFLCVYAAVLCLSGQRVNAADDIHVDLSVLDNVPQEQIGFVASQPLFPVIKKADVPQKKPLIKHKPQTPVAVPTIKPQVPVVAKEEPSLPPAEPEKNIAEPEVIIPDAVRAEADKDPLTIPIVTKRNLAKSNSLENDKTLEAEKNIELPIEGAIRPQPSSTTVLSAKVSDTEVKTSGIMPREVYSLQFHADSSELTPDAEQMLEEMAQKFDAERRKKISIKAHNYDIGEDAFRKKRISLLRATTVRSFFLNRGFKNFSIKLINTTTDDEYKDTVEIEELD